MPRAARMPPPPSSAKFPAGLQVSGTWSVDSVEPSLPRGLLGTRRPEPSVLPGEGQRLSLCHLLPGPLKAQTPTRDCGSSRSSAGLTALVFELAVITSSFSWPGVPRDYLFRCAFSQGSRPLPRSSAAFAAQFPFGTVREDRVSSTHFCPLSTSVLGVSLFSSPRKGLTCRQMSLEGVYSTRASTPPNRAG